MKLKTAPKRLTPKHRLKDLHALVGICFGVLSEKNDDKEICNLTGLSISTIQRLWRGHYSLAVRFGTIQALAAAAGLRVELTEYGCEVRLIKGE